MQHVYTPLKISIPPPPFQFSRNNPAVGYCLKIAGYFFISKLLKLAGYFFVRKLKESSKMIVSYGSFYNQTVGDFQNLEAVCKILGAGGHCRCLKCI